MDTFRAKENWLYVIKFLILHGQCRLQKETLGEHPYKDLDVVGLR